MTIGTNTSRSSNSNPQVWKTIWDAKVPAKIKIFTWKLATESLAVQKSRSMRIPNQLPTYQICGMAEEDGFHAVMECTTASALRWEMRRIWDLPNEQALTRTSDDWVLVLLKSLNKKIKAMIMFLWWRAWHHQNNLIFGKGDASIKHSASYIENYLYNLFRIDAGNLMQKGKNLCTLRRPRRMSLLIQKGLYGLSKCGEDQIMVGLK
jgi:hypothetical protein